MVQDEEKVFIECDHRERKCGVPDLLAREHGAEVRQVSLEDGDYSLGEGILVERKAVADFLQCMVSADLGPQLERFVEAAALPVLIIEGKLLGPTSEDSRLGHEARRSMVSWLVQHRDVWAIQTESSRETAGWIWTIARQAQRGARPPSWHLSKLKGGRARQLACLMAIPRIGHANANKLLDRFGSVRRVLVAPDPELAAVVGPAAARAVVEFLQKDVPPCPPRAIAG